jgi:hypothetical protein
LENKLIISFRKLSYPWKISPLSLPMLPGQATMDTLRLVRYHSDSLSASSISLFPVNDRVAHGNSKTVNQADAFFKPPHPKHAKKAHKTISVSVCWNAVHQHYVLFVDVEFPKLRYLQDSTRNFSRTAWNTRWRPNYSRQILACSNKRFKRRSKYITHNIFGRKERRLKHLEWKCLKSV